jgi:hypothetical protein
VQVTDDGAVYNEHGEWRDDDGRAHADVSGDFAVHVAASEVIAAASSLYYDHPSPERAAETDERRIRWKLNQHLPELPGDEARQVQRERVYRQAMAAADATRDERLDFVDRYARERLANDRAGQRTAEQGAGREAADGAGRDAGRGWSM